MKKNFADTVFVLIVIFFLTSAGQRACADTIFLKDGRRIEGLILSEQQDYYIVRIKIGTTNVDKEMIEKVDRLSSEENLVSLGNQYLESNKYDSALEQYRKALDVNPEYQPAKDAITNAKNIRKKTEEKQLSELENRAMELAGKKNVVDNKMGFRLDVEDDRLRIISVSADSSADEAGLKRNDQIIQIDNRPVKGESVEKIIDNLVKSDSGSYSFLIQRQVDLARKSISYQKRVFVGVGIFLDITDGGLTVNSVIAGEPADLAGLKHGDKVISINGNPTAGISVNDAAELMSEKELPATTFIIQRYVEIEGK